MARVSQGTLGRGFALACGFGCARAVASSAYTTSFGVVAAGYGFVAETGFTLLTNVISFLAALAVVVLALHAAGARGGRRLVLPLPVAVGAYVLLVGGYVAGTAGWFGALPHAAGLAVCAGLYALGMVVLTTCWFELFVVETSVPRVVYCLVGGYVVQAAAYAGLSVLSGRVLCTVCVVLLAVSCALMVWLRPAPVPNAAASQNFAARPPLRLRGLPRAVREVAGGLGGSLLCVFVLTAVVGFLHASVLGNAFEPVVSSISMPLSLACSTVLLAVVVFVSRRVPQATSVYRVLFPVMLATLSLLPFAPRSLGSLTGMAMVVCYDLVGMALVLMLLEVARERGVPPAALVGLYQAGTHLSLVVGLALGGVLNVVHAGEDASYVTMLILACIYPLALVLTYLARRRSRDAEARLGAELLEVSAPCAPAAPPTAVSEHEAQRVVRERVGERVTDYFVEKGLTPREAQVCVQLARGRSVPVIAAELGIAENTAWAHAKRAYAKLGVHGKQELIELVERDVIAARGKRS